MEKQQHDMGKPANRSKRVIQSPTAPTVYSERVYWGLTSDGTHDSPEFLARNRKQAETWKGTLPPELQTKVSIVRMYVTVWQLDRKRRPAPRR